MAIHLNLTAEALTYAVLALAAIVLVLFALLIYNIKRTDTILKRYAFMHIRNEEGRKLVDLLTEYMDTTTKIASKFGTIASRLAQLEEQMGGCFQKLGIVRYNPFPGSGGELSYSMCFLDGANSGFILTGIFNRESCFTYIKPVEKGTAVKYKLSPEEERALAMAIAYVPSSTAENDIDQQE